MVGNLCFKCRRNEIHTSIVHVHVQAKNDVCAFEQYCSVETYTCKGIAKLGMVNQFDRGKKYIEP